MIKHFSKTLITGCAILLFGLSSLTMAKGNLRVEKQATVNAAPATVWKMIGGYNHLDVWHPAVISSDLTGSGHDAGDERLLTLGDGATIREKLVELDDNGMSYTYRILESPLPVSEYVSTISVTPAAGGGSQVTWMSTFNASGADDAKSMDVISGIYDAGLQSLTRHFSGQ